MDSGWGLNTLHFEYFLSLLRWKGKSEEEGLFTNQLFWNEKWIILTDLNWLKYYLLGPRWQRGWRARARPSWDRQIQQNQYNHLNWKKTRKRDHWLHSTQHSFETGNSRYAVERTCDGIGVTIIDTCLSLLIDSSVQPNFASCKMLAEASVEVEVECQTIVTRSSARWGDAVTVMAPGLGN